MEILLGHEFRIGNIVEYCNQLAFIKSISRDNVTLDHYDEVIELHNINAVPINCDLMKSFGFDRFGDSGDFTRKVGKR